MKCVRHVSLNVHSGCEVNRYMVLFNGEFVNDNEIISDVLSECESGFILSNLCGMVS